MWRNILLSITVILPVQSFAADHSLTGSQQAAVAWVEDNADKLWRASRTIWENPEIGLEESVSSETVAGLLERNGFTVTRGVAGMPTAFVAEWGAGAPVVGFHSFAV